MNTISRTMTVTFSVDELIQILRERGVEIPAAPRADATAYSETLALPHAVRLTLDIHWLEALS